MTPRDWRAASVFRPESLIREARRQKGLPDEAVPDVCVLDPDGDLVRYLMRHGGEVMRAWPCYHSELVVWHGIGFVGCAVGAPFAVLIAEQAFACGCELMVSVTSAGQLVAREDPPYFVVIDRALRDEGTSGHYLPPGEYAEVPADVLKRLWPALTAAGRVLRGGSWTTDAPFRETEMAVADATARGLLAVEMEAAGLYAFAQARQRPVLCLAHVTNRLGREGDFEKGEADGALASLRLIEAAAAAWRNSPEFCDAHKSIAG